ncbi:MAG TPA: TonB-dependent receptor [Steroidobacteraceae bacterium]|nr:TonB-dependent receptor [Steroidobacteraceae bacterium]
MKMRHLLTGVSVLPLSCCVLLAQAQTAPATDGSGTATDTLEEVIVTAEHRSSDLQKVALSVSVINGDTLTQHGDKDLAQVLQDIPGVTVQGGIASPIGGSGGPPNIAIRGIGTDGPNKNGATAVYEDGVLIVGGGANFFDVNRVEVLRGPQGTLYGRGTTGGAVNIVTNDPTQVFGGSGQLALGSYALFGTQGSLNLPVSEDVAARVSFNTIKHDGFFSSGASGDGETSARAKLLFKPNEDFSLLLGGVYYTADQTAGGTVNVNATHPQPTDWTPSTDVAGHDVISFKEGYAKFLMNLGFANLIYLPAYQATHSSQENSDGTVSAMPHNNTFTQELRLSNADNARVLWTTGAYYFNTNYYQAFGTPGVFSFNQNYDSVSAAVFGEVTYPLLDTLRLTGGVRESRDTVHHVNTSSFPRTPNPDFYNKTTDHFDWKARVEDDLTNNNLLYGMVSTGDRPGGSVNGQGYKPEVVTAYEVGSKNRIGNRMTLNGALFYYDYGGFQAPESCCFPAVQTIVVSVPAKFYGAEMEAAALLTTADKFTLSANYLKAHFSANTVGIDDAGAPAITLTDGKTIPHAPTWSLSASYGHTFNLPNGATLEPSIDAHYQTRIYTDFDFSLYGSTPGAVQDPSFVQKAYTIANAAISYTTAGGKYVFTAYDNNLSNVIYKTTVTAGMGTDDTASVNDPRTLGVIFAAKF